MKMKKITLLILLLTGKIIFAQQPIVVTDSTPVTVNGLKAGYRIVSETEKEVGNKGNFSRYSVQFYVTNVTGEAKIILYRQGFNLLGNDVPFDLVLFRCLNATGARMTSKEFAVHAQPCVLQTLIEDKDGSSGKTTKNTHLGQVGYWIKSGETFSTKSVVIVPLNENPNFTAAFYPHATSIISSASFNEMYNTQSPDNLRIAKIKNFSTNNYLNIQNGPLVCTPVDNTSLNAQWQLIPVNGTNYYLIKNRLQNNFISIDNNGMLSANDQSTNAMWIIETIGTTNTYMIKNASNNTALINQNGAVQAVTVFGEMQNAKWIIEQ